MLVNLFLPKMLCNVAVLIPIHMFPDHGYNYAGALKVFSRPS